LNLVDALEPPRQLDETTGGEMSRKIVSRRIVLAAVLAVVLVVTTAPAFAENAGTRGGASDHGSAWNVALHWAGQVWKRTNEAIGSLFVHKRAESDPGASTNYTSASDPNGIDLTAPVSDPVASGQFHGNG
jgi:hypothetical protein